MPRAFSLGIFALKSRYRCSDPPHADIFLLAFRVSSRSRAVVKSFTVASIEGIPGNGSFQNISYHIASSLSKKILSAGQKGFSFASAKVIQRMSACSSFWGVPDAIEAASSVRWTVTSG